MGKSPNEPKCTFYPRRTRAETLRTAAETLLRAVGVPFDASRSVAARRLVRARKIPAGVLLNAWRKIFC